MKVQPLLSPLDKRRTLTLAEISESSGIKLATLRLWINRGEMDAFRNGVGKGRKWMMSRAAAELWWQELHQQKV